MFQLLCFFMFFTQFLNCSSNTNNPRKTVDAEQKKISDTVNQKLVSAYIIQNRTNNQNTKNQRLVQNNNDDDNDNDNTKDLSLFQKSDELNTFLDNLGEVKPEDPFYPLKKNCQSKFKFPIKDLLAGKFNDFFESFENSSFVQEEDFDEVECEKPITLSKKNRHSKLSFPSKEILEGKVNPEELKKSNSKNTLKSKLDLKRFSTLTVETQDVTKSDQISDQNESSSENTSNFNSYRSEKNDSFQKS